MESRAKHAEPLSSAPISDLENQAQSLDEQIKFMQGASERATKRRQLVNAVHLAKEKAKNHDVLAYQASENARAFTKSADVAAEYQQAARVSLERLDAAAQGHFSRLAGINDAIETIAFFRSTHAARCKSCAAGVKSGEAKKREAATELKLRSAELADIEAELKKLEQQVDSDDAAVLPQASKWNQAS